jgi:CBS domain-containing protein
MKINAGMLMNKDLTAVSEDDLIQDAVHVLYSQRLAGVPVVSEDWKLVGYLSERDILQGAVPTFLEIVAHSSFLDNCEGDLVQRLRGIGKQTVSDYMTREPVFVEPAASFMTVADLMLRKKIKRLPVAEEGKLIGIIDRGAFCEFMMEGNFFDDPIE